MIVAGVMTGTSADGIDMVVCDLQGQPPDVSVRELAHLTAPLPQAAREIVLRSTGEAISGEDYARLEYALSDAITDLVRRGAEAHPLDLVGVHGQTLWHRPPPSITPTTHQVFNPYRICQLLNVPVVWDFRRADIAAGGQGAPLAPFAHFCLFGHGADPVAVLNVGGIGNITLLPTDQNPERVRAWDTGPGMMLSDHLARTHFDVPFDDGGAIAATGRVSEELLAFALEHPYFGELPPKSCGREEFGAEFASKFAHRSIELQLDHEDTLRTSVALTAESVAVALADEHVQQLIVAGGGARNKTLISELTARVGAADVVVSDQVGIAPERLESVAFALLAYERWHERPANLPTVTGAFEPILLGSIAR